MWIHFSACTALYLAKCLKRTGQRAPVCFFSMHKSLRGFCLQRFTVLRCGFYAAHHRGSAHPWQSWKFDFSTCLFLCLPSAHSVSNCEGKTCPLPELEALWYLKAYIYKKTQPTKHHYHQHQNKTKQNPYLLTSLERLTEVLPVTSKKSKE